jgi:ankyrin repeat protein
MKKILFVFIIMTLSVSLTPKVFQPLSAIAAVNVEDHAKLLVAETEKEAAMSVDEFIILCSEGTPRQIEAAIEAGADVNAKGNDNITPLISAAGKNETEVINILIKAGADVNAEYNTGLTALMHAAWSNNNPEVLSALIKAGADVNAKNDQGWTALMPAAWYNTNPGALKALIQGKADVNAKTDAGASPLMLAVSNNPRAVPALVMAGADINARYSDGKTSLSFAVEGAKGPDTVSFLLREGALVSEDDIKLAQENEYLQDTDVFEELKRSLK